MELRQLQCLVACAQTHSFSNAAAALFTSQSNVSKTIASLERELGQKLFERKQHGIELTDKGKQIYKYALGMLEFGSKIIECADQEDMQELRVSFQPSSWFAEMFCAYYMKKGGDGYRYVITSASGDEVVRRITNDMDSLGFFFVEEERFSKLQEYFQSGHISYYVLHTMCTVLYMGEKAHEQKKNELLLVQNAGDMYLNATRRKDRDSGNEGEAARKQRVVVETNSDYIMQQMLQKTELCNISPRRISHGEVGYAKDVQLLEEDEKKVFFVCLFRNDRVLNAQSKEFLSFIRQYIQEQQANAQ